MNKYKRLLKGAFLKTKIKITNFKKKNPHRYYFLILSIAVVSIATLLRFVLVKVVLKKDSPVLASSGSYEENEDVSSIESLMQEESKNKYYSVSTGTNVRSDVGFSDLRILALRDFFSHYNSPLVESSDEFIEAAEKYNVVNWQLLPAIAMAETKGCQTGISYEQRNCWGWGGSEPNRWEFRTFEDAIDLITHRMINGYGNERMNAKDIQSTYCGQTCMEWQWRWARGVNYYTEKINDFGEKYGLPRTNEINNFNWP